MYGRAPRRKGGSRTAAPPHAPRPLRSLPSSDSPSFRLTPRGRERYPSIVSRDALAHRRHRPDPHARPRVRSGGRHAGRAGPRQPLDRPLLRAPDARRAAALPGDRARTCAASATPSPRRSTPPAGCATGPTTAPRWSARSASTRRRTWSAGRPAARRSRAYAMDRPGRVADVHRPRVALRLRRRRRRHALLPRLRRLRRRTGNPEFVAAPRRRATARPRARSRRATS